MTTATAPPRVLPVSQLSLAWFWTRFHTLRALRKPATTLAIAGVVVMGLSLRVAGVAPASGIVEFYLTLVLPLFAMFFGSGGLREEVEDQTLTYAFVRPIARGWVFAARTAAAAFVALVPVAIGLVIAFDGPLVLLRNLAIAVLGAIAYTAVFAVVGLVMRRPTLLGLGIVAWEQVVGTVPGFLSRLTLRAHLRGLMELGGGDGLLGRLYRPPPWWASLPTLLIVTALVLAFGAWWVSRRELVVPK